MTNELLVSFAGTKAKVNFSVEDGRARNIPDIYDGAIEITSIPTVEELNAHI